MIGVPGKMDVHQKLVFKLTDVELFELMSRTIEYPKLLLWHSFFTWHRVSIAHEAWPRISQVIDQEQFFDQSGIKPSYEESP